MTDRKTALRVPPEKNREACYAGKSFLDDDAVATKVLQALSEEARRTVCCLEVDGAKFLNQAAAERLPESNEIVFSMHGGGPPMHTEDVDVEYGDARLGSVKRTKAPEDEDAVDNCSGDDNEKLAVAIAVFDFSKHKAEDVFLPNAVEFDPDSKNWSLQGINRSRRFRFLVCAAASVALAVVLGGTTMALIIKNKENGENYRSTLGIREVIEGILGDDNETLVDMVSPYRKALEWVTYDDPSEPLPQDSNFLQRYMAVYLYYATSMEREWAWCAPPISANDSIECTFEISVSENRGDNEAFAKNGNRWLSKLHECSWVGILCDDEYNIQEINLGKFRRWMCFRRSMLRLTLIISLASWDPTCSLLTPTGGMQVTGVFPDGIKYLHFLQRLKLAKGELRGSLPSTVGIMKQLTRLELQQNKLTGPIPLEWYHLPNLRHLDLSSNELEGSISTEIGRLEGIDRLFLESNKFTGQIPDEIGRLTNATKIKLDQNQLRGTIPATIGNLSSALQLSFDRNLLTGSIPSEIAQLADTLLDFNVARNPLLGGMLPDAIYEMKQLSLLDVSWSNFTGTISERISQWTQMRYLILNNNHFSGSLPTELGLLTKLLQVTFAGNDLTGAIPLEFCEGVSSSLEVFDADCLPSDDGTGAAEIVCPKNCCKLCCDADGGFCLPPTDS